MKITKQRLKEIIREEVERGPGIKTVFPDFHFLARKATSTGTTGLWGGANTAEEAAEHAQKWVDKGYEIVQATKQLLPALAALGLRERE